MLRSHLHHDDPLAELLRAERLRFAAPAAAAAGPGGGGGQASLPFLYGSSRYQEAPFYEETITLDANSHEIVQNITPGGFLAGVVVQVTAANGVLGSGGAVTQDNPYSVISSLSIDDISGGPVLSPMSGFAHMVKQKYFQPWEGDPAKRADYSRSVNPAFTLRAMVEVRDTLAVLANTDARAQYRVRLTVAPATAVFTAGTGPTDPDVTIKLSYLTWAQPDAVDLLGNPIDPLPLGLVASRFFQHEVPDFAGGNNVFKLGLVGNEIRAIGLIVRDSTAARVDLTDSGAGPIRFRLDSRALWTRNPSQLVEEMNAFYDMLGSGVWTRETGVYIIPRFRKPGTLQGEHWLQTVEQNNMQLELLGGDLSSNTPGSLEVLYDQLAIEGQLPPELEGI